MRIVETRLFKYSELCPDAQSRAREWWRGCAAGDNWFSESVIEDAQRIGEILGISFDIERGSKSKPAIYWSGFASQGDGCAFDAEWSYAKGSTRKIREYAPLDSVLHRIADDLQRAARISFYRCSARTGVSRGNNMHVETYDAAPRVEDDIDSALQDFAHWIYCALESEYEYSMSDDTVAENIECNEYEFTEEGEFA